MSWHHHQLLCDWPQTLPADNIGDRCVTVDKVPRTLPCRHLCMMTPSLYVTRFATSSQCKCYWDLTTTVKIIVDSLVVYFFATHCMSEMETKVIVSRLWHLWLQVVHFDIWCLNKIAKVCYDRLHLAYSANDTIRDAILTCARKPTWVSLIYRTEPTAKKCKTKN